MRSEGEGGSEAKGSPRNPTEKRCFRVDVPAYVLETYRMQFIPSLHRLPKNPSRRNRNMKINIKRREERIDRQTITRKSSPAKITTTGGSPRGIQKRTFKLDLLRQRSLPKDIIKPNRPWSCEFHDSFKRQIDSTGLSLDQGTAEMG